MQDNTLTLAADWLDTASPTTTDTIVGDSVTTTFTTYPNTYSDSCVTVWPTYYHWCDQGTPRPIKLKMSEVEHLRQLARGNKRLKKILQKFTPQIEIEVDFD